MNHSRSHWTEWWYLFLLRVEQSNGWLAVTLTVTLTVVYKWHNQSRISHPSIIEGGWFAIGWVNSKTWLDHWLGDYSFLSFHPDSVSHSHSLTDRDWLSHVNVSVTVSLSHSHWLSQWLSHCQSVTESVSESLSLSVTVTHWLTLSLAESTKDRYTRESYKSYTIFSFVSSANRMLPRFNQSAGGSKSNQTTLARHDFRLYTNLLSVADHYGYLADRPNDKQSQTSSRPFSYIHGLDNCIVGVVFFWLVGVSNRLRMILQCASVPFPVGFFARFLIFL